MTADVCNDNVRRFFLGKLVDELRFVHDQAERLGIGNPEGARSAGKGWIRAEPKRDDR